MIEPLNIDVEFYKKHPNVLYNSAKVAVKVNELIDKINELEKRLNDET